MRNVSSNNTFPECTVRAGGTTRWGASIVLTFRFVSALTYRGKSYLVMYRSAPISNENVKTLKNLYVVSRR